MEIDQVQSDQFYGHLRKCRCCFKDLVLNESQTVIQPSHRQTFQDMTGIALLGDPDFSSYVCLNCVQLFDVFSVLQGAADKMQKLQIKYYEHVRKLCQPRVDIEIEVVDHNGMIVEKNRFPSKSLIRNTSTPVDDDGLNVHVQSYEGFDFLKEIENDNRDNHIEQAEASPEDSDCFECTVHLKRSNFETIENISNSNMETTLAHHIISHHQQVNAKHNLHGLKHFKCLFDACDKSFYSKKFLNEHFYRVHKLDPQVFDENLSSVYVINSVLYFRIKQLVISVECSSRTQIL